MLNAFRNVLLANIPTQLVSVKSALLNVFYVKLHLSVQNVRMMDQLHQLMKDSIL